MRTAQKEASEPTTSKARDGALDRPDWGRALQPDDPAAVGAERSVPAGAKGSTAGETRNDVLTAGEVAALLRVDRKTVYAAVKAGTLPALRLRHLIRFSRSAVLRSLAGSIDSRSSRKR